ncbi:MAG: hypothetical protein ACYC2G_10300 [Gemmatimonadaceae bacterium]|jgi:hypothetical protein
MIHHHIDVGGALRRSVCHLYSDLVTRPTGAAVRQEIEQQLDRIHDRTLTVIDFSHVGLLDFSCADEVVAKLLLHSISDAGAPVGFFLFRGVREEHLEAIEAVLERHGLVLLVQTEDGAVHVVGELGDRERAAWEALDRVGRHSAAALSSVLGTTLEETLSALDALCARRLAIRLDDGYLAISSALVARGIQ